MNIQDAKAHLSRLVAAAEAGEEVVIARKGVPTVRLVPAVDAEATIRFDLFPTKLSDDAIRESMRPLTDNEALEWGGIAWPGGGIGHDSDPH